MSGNQTNLEYNSGGVRAHSILITCFFLYIVLFMDRMLFSVILEPMKLDLELTDTQVGLIQTIFLISISLAAFPAAFIADRWSRRKYIGTMTLCWSVFTFATGLAKNFWGIVAPRVLVGVSIPGLYSAGIAMVSGAYPERLRGRVIGLMNTSAPIGSAIGMIMGGYISAHHGGWRKPFFIFAIPGIILAIFAFFLTDYKITEETGHSERQKGFIDSAVSLFRIPTLKWLYLGFAMQNIMVFSYLIWSPAFVMRTRGISEYEAGIIVGLVNLMGAIGSPLGGIVADKWQEKNPRGRMYTPALVMFIATLSFIATIIFEYKGIGFVIGLLMGAMMIMGVAGQIAVSQDVVTPDLKSMTWGMNVFCAFALGGGWAPWLIGAISDTLGGGAYGLKIALLISSGGGFISVIFFLISARHYPADAAKVKGYVLEAE